MNRTVMMALVIIFRCHGDWHNYACLTMRYYGSLLERLMLRRLRCFIGAVCNDASDFLPSSRPLVRIA